MNCTHANPFRKALLSALLLAAAMLLSGLSGCATTENESDIPWNVPQSWEGRPGIPGLTGD